MIADRFKICSLIARGGMGKVYLAEQSPLGRLCALKILNTNYTGDADPEFHTRFFREARITSQIKHPNSVTIFDYGKTDDEIYYMAMEYLEGRTLYQTLREGGPMAEERVGRIAVQICRAVREAHALNVIHRDLKPANIFLTKHGEVTGDGEFVKVLDFGLVKHLSERPEEQLTQTGLFMGSPKYMAPEQIQGGHVDARTDIYSLGIILYEMLAGKVPFERPTSVNILMAHVAEPPPLMREVNPNLVCSPAFEEIVMRCIAKEPSVRFRTMEEVLHAIRLAHGGSMTGQIGTMSTAEASALLGSALRSLPPPPRLPAGVSASHTPGPLSRERAEIALPEERPRSKWGWIAAGTLLAVAIGGSLGMAMFRWTSGAPLASVIPTKANATTPAATTVEVTPSSSSQASAAPSATPPPLRRVRVTTDPPGAAVFRSEVKVCEVTPCEVIASGDPPSSPVLSFSKKGYRREEYAMKGEDESVVVKLVRVRSSGSAVPVGAVSSGTSKEEATSPATPPESESTPSGFKGTPY